MKNTMHRTEKMQLHILVKDAFPHLKKIKKENDQQAFNRAIESLLPGINRYMSNWLNRAIKNNKIPAGKYKVADLVNELYIQVYDHFHEVENSTNLHSWLFKKADELLEDTEIEEEFDNLFFKNIDNYTKVEWEEMEENFSTDGDGDLVMIEELDDPSYPKNDYVLEDVFIEDKDKELIEKLSKQLSEEQINRHIDMILHQLSIPVRTVFDLAVREQFKLDEIAHIKRGSVQEIEQYLAKAKKYIRVTFEKRFIQKF